MAHCGGQSLTDCRIRGQKLPYDTAAVCLICSCKSVACGKKPGRTDPEDRILCELVGMGSPDLCIATHVYNELLASGAPGVTRLDMMG